MILPLIQSLISGFTLLASIVLAYIVYKNNPKNIRNLIVSYLCWLNFIWIIITNLTLRPVFYPVILYLIRSTILIGTLQVFCFFLLVNTLPARKLQFSKKHLAILTIITTIVCATTISPFAFTKVEIIGEKANPAVGPGMLVFALFALSLSASSIYTLVRRLKSSSGVEKEQLRFILVGMFLMLGLIISTIFIPVILLKQSVFVSFAPLYVLIFLISTTYAIVKHRLLDIRLVVTKTLAFSLLIVFLGGLYSFLLVIAGDKLFNHSLSSEQLAYSGILTLIVTFTFFPLERVIEKLTDKIFYKNRKPPEAILKHLSNATNSSIDINKLSNMILDTITEELKITRGAIIVYPREGQRKVSFIFQKGYDKPLDITNSDIEYLSETSKTMVFEEVSEGTTKDLLRHFKIAVCLPLLSHGEQVGLAIFGEKASGSIYSDDEINLLEIFAPEAAIAIQNALSYEEIIQFNTNLQKEVQKATDDMKAITEDVYKKNIELNKVSKELTEANEKLQQLDHLKDEFVSLASHELRTPMTAIKSYLWMFLQYNSTTLDPKERQYIERAYEATDRLITLVNDMLNVSRIESGRMNILFMPVDLPKLAKEVTEELTPTALKQNVFFKIDAPDSLAQVSGDQNKIREVITNLVGNALKFSNKGDTITIKMHQEGEMIVTDVMDTGKGIKKEDLQKLFQKFGIVGNNYLQKTNSQGTGLGLYISKSIVELHGGKIWVNSEGENKGTTFSFSLKVQTHEAQAGTQELPAAEHPSQPAATV